MRVRRLAGQIALAVGAVLVVFVTLEVTLRRWPTLLGQTFANGALTRYSTKADGIYVFDRRLGMNFMIPNHRATMYYNGFVWEHRTDALGFRNEPLHVPADVVLLGDSVVYGHGVNYEHTIGHLLERRSGLRVANLGRQGDCAFQEAYLLTTYLPTFRPRVVVHVFTPNDIDDLYFHLGPRRMGEFIAQPLDRIAYPARTEVAQLLAEHGRRVRNRRLWRRLNDELMVFKVVQWLRYEAGWLASLPRAEAADTARDVPNADTDPASLGWRYTAHALAYMKLLADRAGARFITVPFTSGRQREILREIAGRHAIEFVDAPLFDASLVLPNDGHLSPEGARVMAGAIADAIARRPAVPASR